MMNDYSRRIGLSPSGVVWVAYDRANVDTMTTRLASLWGKLSPAKLAKIAESDDDDLRATAQFEIQRREEEYKRLRATVMKLKGRRSTNKARAMAWSEAKDQEYWAVSERLHEARKRRVRTIA